jgi:uncharacterized membrane protein YciS (DUF1049 family)
MKNSITIALLILVAVFVIAWDLANQGLKSIILGQRLAQGKSHIGQLQFLYALCTTEMAVMGLPIMLVEKSLRNDTVLK